jgi:hypothetical protein
VGHCIVGRILLHKPSTLGIMLGMKCPIHKVELVCYCPVCRGSVTSERKAATSRENGKLGGRPKGSKNKPKVTKPKTTERKGVR